MKRTIWLPLAALSVTLTLLVSCSKAEDAGIAKGRQLIEVTGAMKMAMDMMNTTVPQQITVQKTAHPEIAPAFWDELIAAFKNEVDTSFGELTEPMARLYAMHFTEQEMDVLLDFYRSETGKKALRELPVLMQETMQLGQEWGKKAGQRAEARARQVVQQKSNAQK